MAKGVRKQVYADRYRGRLSFGADASTAVFETFNTGMNVGRSTAMKWTLLGALLGPNSQGDIPLACASGAIFAQLAIGTQTALLDCDDMQVITSLGHVQELTSQGAESAGYPLAFPILQPIPVFAQAITIGMQAINQANYNSSEWWYELVYIPTPTSDAEIVEYLAAFGQV